MRMIVFPFLRPGLCSVSFFQFVFSRSRCAETKGMTSTCKHSGAGRDNPLLNGPPEGRVHSSRGPCCRTSFFHLLQPLNVQRGVHTSCPHGGRLPSLPGSNFHCLNNMYNTCFIQLLRWQSSTVLCQLLVCTTALLEPELSLQAVIDAHNSFRKVPA